MSGKGVGVRVRLTLAVALAVAAGARAGGELTPDERQALERQAGKLNQQGMALYRQRKLPEAAAALEQALALRRRLYPKDHPLLARSLTHLGIVQQARGDLAGAEKYHRDALAMCRRLFPDDHRDLAYSLNNLGYVLQARGDLAGAEKHFRDALAMYQRLFPDDHPELAGCLNNLGTILLARGDLAGAEKLLRDTLAMYRRLYPKDHPLLAGGLNNVGYVLRAQGDLAGAEKHYREALAMCRRLYPNDHPDLARSLNNVGFVLRARGDLAGAEKHFHDALAMCRRLYPRDHPDLAYSLNSVGLVLQARGDLAGAEKHFRDALALRRRLYPRGHTDLATSLHNVGSVLLDQGDLGGAEKSFRDALAMYRRLYPRGHPALATGLNNLGYVLRAREDLAGAEELYRDALTMRQRLYPRDHPDLATSLTNLGLLLQARGDRAGAEQHLRDALGVRQRLLVQEGALLAEADALNLAASLPHPRDAFLSVTRGRAEDAAAYELLWQGRSALTRLAERRHRDLLASNDPATRDLGDRLVSARQRLAHLLLAPAAGAARHAAEIRKLTAAKEDLEKELAGRLRLELPPAGPAPPPARLADRLPAGAVFLDFYRYEQLEFDPKVPGGEGGRSTPRYAAFVLSRGRPAVRVELGEAAAVGRAWAAWHRAITEDRPAAQERQAAVALARLIWEPIRGKLPAGVRTVYLAPDGALTQVPFAALPGAKPGTVLLEECAFATVPHGPFLLERLTEKEQARPGGGTLLAVGGVDYAPPPGGPAAGKRGAWAPLPATRAETERVAALAEQYARLKARRLRGDEATTAGVLEALPQARYAHLATHGFFADAQFRSAFQVDPEAFNHRTPDRRGGARSPLVLSGLVFAGANRQGDAAEADRGILTAEGIVGLRLDGLELAVLSACNTGLGEVGGNEGVYGLQRAFHVAGCKNVIASLWSVEDESTAALMTLFYTHLWRDKLTPLEALRQAQLHLYRHPQQVRQLARRDFEEVPLPREGPANQGPHARTAQWAAFTFSGVATPPIPK